VLYAIAETDAASRKSDGCDGTVTKSLKTRARMPCSVMHGTQGGLATAALVLHMQQDYLAIVER